MQREATLCGSDHEIGFATYADDASTTVSDGSIYDDAHGVVQHATRDGTRVAMSDAFSYQLEHTQVHHNSQMVNGETSASKTQRLTADRGSRLQYIDSILEKHAAAEELEKPPLISRGQPEGSGYTDGKASSSVSSTGLEKSAEVAGSFTSFQLKEPSILGDYQDTDMRMNILSLHNDAMTEFDSAISTKVTDDITNSTFSINDLETRADVIQCQCVEAFRLACLRYGKGRNVQRYSRFYETKLKAAMDLAKELLVDKYILKLQRIMEEHYSDCSKRDQTLKEQSKEIVRLQQLLTDRDAQTVYI